LAVARSVNGLRLAPGRPQREHEQAFGRASAQDWVRRNFSPAARAGTERPVDALERTPAKGIRSLLWISDDPQSTT
jgi:hypothetical protein